MDAWELNPDDVWIVAYPGNHGPYRYDGEKLYHLKLPKSPAEDAAGALWMACGGDGVWKYDGKDVTRYPIGNGAYVISIYRDRKGKVWIGTVKHGVYALVSGRFEPFKPSEPSK